MKASRDILIFQLFNWSTNFAWFAYFVQRFDPALFGKVAAAEVAVTFLGVFFLSTSLRAYEEGGGVYYDTELRLLLLKLSFFIVVALFYFFGLIDVAMAVAAVTVLVTPAHLPMKLGHNAGITSVLGVKIALIGLMFFLPSLEAELNSLAILAAVYFFPNFIYGLAGYLFYLRSIKCRLKGDDSQFYRILFSARVLSGLVASAVLNSYQGFIIKNVIQYSQYLSIIERIIRSAYSFVFPYIVRKGLVKAPKFWWAAALASFVIVISAVSLSYFKGLAVLLPVGIDVYMTMFSGRFFIIDVLFILSVIIYRL